MANVYDLTGKVTGKMDLPEVFEVAPRQDLWTRVILAIQSHLRQAYGTDILAGMRTAAHYHGRRRYRYSMMNKEMSRQPRQHGHTNQMWRARMAPHTVKGRPSHGPVAEKIWDQKVNVKENALAIKSAIAATANRELLLLRHPSIETLKDVPIIVTNDFESLTKAKDVENVFNHLGLQSEIARSKETKIRGTKGQRRGRRYIEKPGVLVVFANDKGIAMAAKNLPGVDVCNVRNLNVALLAPGAIPRLTIWSQDAIKALEAPKAVKA